ncbi:hypothetical protein ACA910_020853 [Epithemia clementina (nom. ined.)]
MLLKWKMATSAQEWVKDKTRRANWVDIANVLFQEPGKLDQSEKRMRLARPHQQKRNFWPRKGRIAASLAESWQGQDKKEFMATSCSCPFPDSLETVDPRASPPYAPVDQRRFTRAADRIWSTRFHLQKHFMGSRILKYWTILFGSTAAAACRQHNIVRYLEIVNQIGVPTLLQALLIAGRLFNCFMFMRAAPAKIVILVLSREKLLTKFMGVNNFCIRTAFKWVAKFAKLKAMKIWRLSHPALRKIPSSVARKTIQCLFKNTKLAVRRPLY